MKAWYPIDKNIKSLYPLTGSSPMMPIKSSWEILELVNTLEKSPSIVQLWSRETAATIVKKETLTQMILFQGAKAKLGQGKQICYTKGTEKNVKAEEREKKKYFTPGEGNKSSSACHQRTQCREVTSCVSHSVMSNSLWPHGL